MSIAFGGCNFFLIEDGSASGDTVGFGATPPAGSMLLLFICSPDRSLAALTGYTKLGGKQAANGLFFDVFYKLADGAENAITFNYGTNTPFAGHTRYYTDPPAATLYEVASSTSFVDATGINVNQTGDLGADGQPLVAAAAFMNHIFNGFAGSLADCGADAAAWANPSPGSFAVTQFGGCVEGDHVALDLLLGDRYGCAFSYNATGQVDADFVGYLIAFGSAPAPGDVALAGDAALLDATGALSVVGSGVELAGDAGLLEGAGALEIDGGHVELVGEARLIDPRGFLSTPTPIEPPVVKPAVVLGCGEYEVFAFTRGGHEIVGRLEFDEVAWGRALDATSRATLTINGVSNLGALQRCCPLLGELNPLEHELGIYRLVPGTSTKLRVWSGPITRMRFPSEQAIIECFDLSGWLTIRTLHANHNLVQTDLVNMWVAWVEDAMSVENSAGVYPVVVALSGILGDRLTTIVEHSYAADAIAEIATTGIDWTTVDRVMRAGPVLPQPAFDAVDSLPLLIDESFRVAPEIIVDGLDGANCWFVGGGSTGGGGASIFGEYGPAFPATPDHVAQPAAPDYAAIEAQFGRIERTVSETRILDQPSIDQAARTRYDLTKRPVPFITGGELLPTAPLPIDKIIPGMLVRVRLNRACKPIDAVMRMKQLDAAGNNDGSESVNLGLEPLGSVA